MFDDTINSISGDLFDCNRIRHLEPAGTAGWVARVGSARGVAPGLIKGYWTRDAEGGRSYTWIVFEDRPAAEAFAVSVRANAVHQAEHGVTNVSLAITEVEAET